tara:strand:- start:205 stop:813 length:609 start_codon:yes stop_codon:yes gene_type:complete
MTKDKKKISSNDLKLWYQIVDKVEPIQKRDNPNIKDQEQSSIDAGSIISGDVNQQKIIKKKISKDKVAIKLAPSKVPLRKDELLKFTGIHRRLEQKMSRGQIDIDSTLDLHGMTQEEAKHATINFIKVANKNNLKIILIITGKGISNENTNTRYKNRYERGVLNKNLPAWLQMPEVRDYVNGYRYANQKHGGEGAYYILLKA